MQAILTAQAISLGGTVVPNYLSINTGLTPLTALPSQNATAANCTARSCNCCSRTLTSEQLHLDMLDGVSGHTTFCGPRECSATDKGDSFILSSGGDPNLVEYKADVDDCRPSYYPTADWQPNVDKFGLGVFVGGLVGSKSYGVTTNVKVRSIKVLNDNFRGPLSAYICALEKIETWLQLHPTKSATILFDAQFDMNSTISFPLISSMLSLYASRVIGLTFALNCAYPAQEVDIITVGTVDRNMNLPLGNASCMDVVAAAYGVRSTQPNNLTCAFNATPGFAVVASVLTEVMQERTDLTALQIRQLVVSPFDNELGESKRIGGVPGDGFKKLIKYSCPDNCVACDSPRNCTVCCHGKSICSCPLNTATVRGTCTAVTCPKGATSVAHPDFCDVSVNCQGRRARRCGRRHGARRVFDVLLSRCVEESDGFAVRGCRPLPRC